MIWILCTTYLAIPFTEKPESLCFFRHEHTVEMARLSVSDLYCFVSPPYNLTGSD